MGTISDLCSRTQKSSEKCVCALAVTRKRQVAPVHLLQIHLTFSKSVMVSMGVSKFGANGPEFYLIFIDAGVKINGTYYREELLTYKLPPVRSVVSSLFSSKAVFLLTERTRQSAF